MTYSVSAYNVVDLPETMPLSEAFGIFDGSSITRATVSNVEDGKYAELSKDEYLDFYYSASEVTLHRKITKTPFRGTAINLYVDKSVHSYYVGSGIQIGMYGSDNYVCYVAEGKDAIDLMYIESMYRDANEQYNGEEVHIDTTKDFLKMPTAGWSQNPVKEAAANSLLPYEFTGKYEDQITREDFCKLLGNFIAVASGCKTLDDYMQQREVPYLRNVFSDSIGNDESIDMMYALGIINGKTEDTFEPYGLLTRQEASKLLCKVAEQFKFIITNAGLNYSDKNTIDPWAEYYVTWATDKGIMTGVGDNNFDPQGSYTVEQAIATMNRLYNFIK